MGGLICPPRDKAKFGQQSGKLFLENRAGVVAPHFCGGIKLKKAVTSRKKAQKAQQNWRLSKLAGFPASPETRLQKPCLTLLEPSPFCAFCAPSWPLNRRI
jgi:hypothetical protein